MVYLYIDTNAIKLLCLKKSMLGQYETFFFEKKHEAVLLEKGKPVNSDLLASAIKEALSLTSENAHCEKEVTLILPQEAFYFLRAEVPVDIAPSAISSFIRDKAHSVLPVNLNQCLSDYSVQEANNQKIVTLYALNKEYFELYKQSFSLIDLKIQSIIPETLAYFKLFDKTLRKEKKEIIAFITYEKKKISGYLYDSYGLTDANKWTEEIDNNIEDVLKIKAQDHEQKKMKLNRIILSGTGSETIRQDTFTKAVGVWTNPLKRIIPNFLNDYLKMIVVNQNKTFPILNFDVCFGAFVFQQENKSFSLLKNNHKFSQNISPPSLPNIPLSKKEIFIFLGSFLASFLFFIVLSYFKPSVNLNSIFNNQEQKTNITPSPTTAPSPTPTPSIKKEELKLKILNGSGTAGKAGEAKDILSKAGYGEILTGNANNFDYEKTEIQVKKSKKDAVGYLKSDLKEYVADIVSSDLAETEAADAVIIVGKDF